MPGVSDLTAHVIVAEIGVDMARFPTRRTSDLMDNPVSAQRRKCRKTPIHPRSQGRALAQNRPGDRRLGSRARQRLLPAGSVPPATARRGAKKAILAVAASMLTAAYHMLKDGVEYHDLGADHFTRRDHTKTILRLVRRLNELGCQVQLTEQAA